MEIDHSENGQEFLDKLRLSAPQWGNAWNFQWAFRGHGDESWKLLPSALRSPIPDCIRKTMDVLRDTEEYRALPSLCDFPEAILRAAAEQELILQFVKASQDAGLPTPVPRTLGGIEALSARFTNNEYAQDELELRALAQHHGIPTRLLDWSETGWIAAFFAAKDCFTLQSDQDARKAPKQLAVWALNVSDLESRRHEFQHLHVFRANRADNQFLRAQRGIFTYDMLHRGELSKGLFTELDKSVDENVQLKKFTLDARHASELLRCLFLERISFHSLMPSYDSAAELAKVLAVWATRWQSDRAVTPSDP